MRILLIEDDKNLNDTLKYRLEREGYDVDCCFDGEEALYYIGRHAADLIVLDRMLPHIPGTELLRRLRSSGDKVPVLMLTALGTLENRVEGLDLGADDYLVKPFAMEELLARIRSLLRRQINLSDALFHNRIVVGDLTYCAQNNELTGPNGSCTLSKREGSLLEVFLVNSNQVLSRGQLLNKVWGAACEVEDGNLDNYIFFLRRRLKSVGTTLAITTVRGIGYRLQ